MKKLMPAGVLGLVGLVTVGLLSLPSVTAAANADDVFTKRDDDTPELVLVADDDDDDDTDLKKQGASRDDTSRSRNTGNSRSRRDHTNSRFSKVSRDRDHSRGDLTRDWTRDGKKKQQRDWSANRTNDRSRNDTRG